MKINRAAESLITAQMVRDALRYNPLDGTFVWKLYRGSAKVGEAAGFVMKSGYVRIRLNGRGYFAHRLAWLYMLGR